MSRSPTRKTKNRFEETFLPGLRYALFFLILLSVIGGGIYLFRKYQSSFFASVENSLRRYLQDEWGLDVQFSEVKYGQLLKGQVEFRNFSVMNPDTGDLILAAKNAIATVLLSELAEKEIVIEELLMNEPFMTITRDSFQGWNIFKRNPFRAPELTTSQAPEGWNLTVKSLRIENGLVEYSDMTQAEPFKKTLTSVRLKLERDREERTKVQIDLMAKVAAHMVPLVVTAQYDMDSDSAVVQASYDEQNWMFEGQVLNVKQTPRVEGFLDIGGVKLSKLELVDGLSISGQMTAHVQVVAEGAHPSQIKETMALEGSADFRAGYLKGLNPFQDLLSVFTERFREHARNEYLSSLHQYVYRDDMFFDSLQFDFYYLNGKADIEEMRMQYRDYILELSGVFQRPGNEADFLGQLVLMPGFSAWWVDAFPGMSELKNEHERIALPLIYRGVYPHASFKTDLDYLDEIFNPVVKEIKPVKDEEPLDLMKL